MKTVECLKKYFLFLIILIIVVTTYSSAQTTVFEDDFESGTGKWVLTGVWALSANNFYSGNYSLTESPLGNYTNMQKSSATIANNIDFSSYLSAEISFWGKFDIESAFDYMYLEISKDGGSTYIKVAEYSGVSSIWKKYTYNIGSVAGYPNVKLRFRFVSDQAVVGDGMNIDDLIISGSLIDDSPPLIIHNGPVFYEGVLGDYFVNCEISDASGIASATLEYMVDGSGPYSLIGNNVRGDQYNFVIPVQIPGSNISYIIKAADNASPANETDTSLAMVYKYISGSYLGYDDAGVDALTTINNSAAAAVKITVRDGKYGFLVTALIRNYTDINNPNDSMLFHVWDNNGGIPGNDIITPFLVSPEASLENPYPFTRIDLRGYAPQLGDLTGDFFIGVTVPQNSVNLLVSNNSSGRSFSFDGTSWNTTALLKDYQFRAIINETTSPLPVKLSMFSAEVTDNSVTLNWNTATEVNNYGFEIERQNKELSNKNLAWEKIGFVLGHGNSNSTKNYSYKDKSSLSAGIYEYRLKQIDIDGKFEYSKIVKVTLSAPSEFILEQNYPNPFNPITTIKYKITSTASSNDNNSLVVLKVFDVLGEEVETLVNEFQRPGIYEVEFNASDLPSGLYFYSIRSGKFAQTYKMILMK